MASLSHAIKGSTVTAAATDIDYMAGGLVNPDHVF